MLGCLAVGWLGGKHYWCFENQKYWAGLEIKAGDFFFFWVWGGAWAYAKIFGSVEEKNSYLGMEGLWLNLLDNVERRKREKKSRDGGLILWGFSKGFKSVFPWKNYDARGAM